MMEFEIRTHLTKKCSVKATENEVADFRTCISKDMDSCCQSLCDGNSRAFQRKLLDRDGERADI